MIRLDGEDQGWQQRLCGTSPFRIKIRCGHLAGTLGDGNRSLPFRIAKAVDQRNAKISVKCGRDLNRAACGLHGPRAMFIVVADQLCRDTCFGHLGG
jgi:hypothetical protein